MPMQKQELAQLHDKDKWWCDFDAKKYMDAASLQMQTLCGFIIGTIGVATLQRQVWDKFMQKQLLA